MIPTGFHCVELKDVELSDVVIGINAVGLMSVAGAYLKGTSNIITVETRPKCIEAAKKYGATEFIYYKNGSISE